MITGNAKSTDDKDNNATEISGNMPAKSNGTGVFMSVGIIDIRFEITTPYIVRNTPMIM